MRPLLLITLFSALLLAFTTEKTNPGITCTLTSDKSVYKVGELPKLKVEIINTAKTDIYLIGSLDGSELKWRFPYCYYTIDKAGFEKERVMRCGNMNSLRPSDFKLVKAGEKFNPYETIDGYGFFGDYTINNVSTFKTTGVYKIKFHYSTKSQNIADFRGDRGFQKTDPDSLQINSFFSKVPKVEIISNEIEFRVEQ